MRIIRSFSVALAAAGMVAGSACVTVPAGTTAGEGSDHTAPVTDEELAAVAPELIKEQGPSPDGGDDEGGAIAPPEGAVGTESADSAQQVADTEPAPEDPDFEGVEEPPLSEVPEPAPPPQRGQVIGRVDAVQLPTAILRHGVKAGVKPGWALYAGDRIATGDSGRIEISLVDGSKLRLGSRTEAELDVPWATDNGQGVRSGLRVVRGNFGFEASRLRRPGVPRPTVAVGETMRATVQAGEVWGRTEESQELLVLVHGVVDAHVSDRPSQRLSEPESMLVVPRERPPRPVIPVAPERLSVWLPQSRLIAGRPVLSAEGGWSVSLAANPSERAVEAIACRLQSKGYPTEMVAVERGGTLWHRAVIRRFATQEDAKRFARSAVGLGLTGAWVIPPG